MLPYQGRCQRRSHEWVVEAPDGRAIAVTNRPMAGGAWSRPTRTSPKGGALKSKSNTAHHDALTVAQPRGIERPTKTSSCAARKRPDRHSPCSAST